jgi:hypothetical protein
VVAVGDTNGLALAQESHEAILHNGGCLKPEHTLRNSRVTPNSPVWELAYVDDHHVTQRIPRNRVGCFPDHSNGCLFCAADGGVFDDVGIVGKSVDAYAKNSVTQNVKKSYRYQQRYEVVGTEVDGHIGRVGTPLEKLRQICRLVGGFLMKSWISKWELQSIVGAFVNPFMYKRPLYVRLFEALRRHKQHDRQ